MIDFFDNYIINPTTEVTPIIRISPFNGLNVDSVGANDKNSVDNYFNNRFGTDWSFTIKARDAISIALSYYQLCHEDVVTILTTTNNFYISSCVTKEIEKYCKWTREITEKTKVIFVNHEFGFPYLDLSSLRQYNLPIIEDCAHSFLSVDSDSLIGRVGDFVIYSLPKFFSMQIGGVLVSNTYKLNKETLPVAAYKYIYSNLSTYLSLVDQFAECRQLNHSYLSSQLSELGIIPRFDISERVYPGVFLFSWKENIDYDGLKSFMQNNGVESSVFYGEKAFFIPVHHKLTKHYLDYMISLLKYYYNASC